ncbi:DDE-type integrase/transposase/recombinase, partial [Mesorhizobium australicum]|uniref:DDE-type integrase/transposase/recombinase n=1 Tax=Mesorhizobium australicum TaxID=536018 RepID=UPI003337DF4B
WRRVRAGLRQKGMIVNHKKIRRLMREHDRQPRMRQRYTVTTDSDHNQPIFPNLARDIICDGPNQLWVADITYVTVVGGFAYVAVVLDAWSRRVVGYAISRSIDARLTLAALTAAVEGRKPPSGCVHHSDRGSQGGFNMPRQPIAITLPPTAWSVPWAGAAIPTTTQRRKAS